MYHASLTQSLCHRLSCDTFSTMTYMYCDNIHPVIKWSQLRQSYVHLIHKYQNIMYWTTYKAWCCIKYNFCNGINFIVYKYRKMTITLGFASEIIIFFYPISVPFHRFPSRSNYSLHHIFIRNRVKYVNFISFSFTPSLIILLTKSWNVSLVANHILDAANWVGEWRDGALIPVEVVKFFWRLGYSIQWHLSWWNRNDNQHSFIN